MNRRAMEVMVLVVLGMQPVIRMGNVWARKHLATSSNPVTTTAAKVVSVVT